MSAASTIGSLFDAKPDGGRLRTVLDDWKLDDHTLTACRRDLEADEIAGGALDESSALAALQALAEIDRLTAMALFEGFIDEAGLETVEAR